MFCHWAALETSRNIWLNCWTRPSQVTRRLYKNLYANGESSIVAMEYKA